MFIGVREPGPEQNTSQSQIVTQITVPNRPEISIVVPVHNETGNVGTLVAEIAVAMEGRAYEMIFVDDASTDDTRAALTALKAEFPTLRVLGHRQNTPTPHHITRHHRTPQGTTRHHTSPHHTATPRHTTTHWTTPHHNELLG